MKSRQLRKWMGVSTIEQVVTRANLALTSMVSDNCGREDATRMNVLGPLAELHYATTKEVWPV